MSFDKYTLRLPRNKGKGKKNKETKKFKQLLKFMKFSTCMIEQKLVLYS